MPSEEELYQEHILDHYEDPFHQGTLAGATHAHEDKNPLCGDVLTVFVSLDDGVITDVAFKGQGCAISMASASMMTEVLKGKTAAEAGRIFDSFHRMCTEDDFDPAAAEDGDADALERLAVLSGVREFPVRVKCATLAWHTMNAAVTGEAEVSTE